MIQEILIDESFSSDNTFEETRNFITSISNLKKFDTDNNILIIETEKGVFIRTTNVDWSTFFGMISELKGHRYTSLKIGVWDEITSKVKKPLNLFGDISLADLQNRL